MATPKKAGTRGLKGRAGGAKPLARDAVEFTVGDVVEIKSFGPGRVVELRGPLGPGGLQIYRVKLPKKRVGPTGYIEVLGKQLKPAVRTKTINIEYPGRQPASRAGRIVDPVTPGE